jgi:hypothetical protein
LARRLSTQEAAGVLGISVDAVRKRAERGQLRSEREGNRLYILLDTGAPESGPNVETRPNVEVQLVDELRDRLRYVERQLEAERGAHAESRRLLAAALERIPPQLEPSSEPRESPVNASVTAAGTAAGEKPGGREQAVECLQQRSGWRAPVAKLPWWQYVLGLLLVGLALGFAGTVIAALISMFASVVASIVSALMASGG